MVVDSKTTDDTFDRIDRLSYGRSYLKIVIQTDPYCTGGARNLGLDNVTGDYVAFFDIDDRPMPNYLSVMMELLKDSDVVFCGYKCVTDLTDDDVSEERNITIYDSKGAIRGVISTELSGMPWGSMWRRSLIESSGVRFLKDTIAEDTDFIIRTLAYAERITYTTQELYLYYVRPGYYNWKMNCVLRAHVYYNLISFLEQHCPDAEEDYSRIALLIQIRWGSLRSTCEFKSLMKDEVMTRWAGQIRSNKLKIEYSIAHSVPTLYCALMKTADKVIKKLGIRIKY